VTRPFSSFVKLSCLVLTNRLAIAEVFKEPQVLARGMKIELPHAVAGTVALVGSPMKFSETPIVHEIPPPALGQHTDDILTRVLHKTPEQIAELKAKGIV